MPENKYTIADGETSESHLYMKRYKWSMFMEIERNLLLKGWAPDRFYL